MNTLCLNNRTLKVFSVAFCLVAALKPLFRTLRLANLFQATPWDNQIYICRYIVLLNIWANMLYADSICTDANTCTCTLQYKYKLFKKAYHTSVLNSERTVAIWKLSIKSDEFIKWHTHLASGDGGELGVFSMLWHHAKIRTGNIHRKERLSHATLLSWCYHTGCKFC